MTNFFNPNAGFDANKPQDYDYQAQQQKLAMQQALAQRLGQPLDQGKMVSGWYVAPGAGATMASALSQALGGYMQVKGGEAQGELDKADRNALAAARKAYGDASDPANYIDKTLEAVPTPEAQYSYKHPEQVGPSDPRAPQADIPVADQRTTFPGQTTQFPTSLPQNASPLAQMQQANAQPQISPAPWAPEGTAAPQQVGVTGQRESTFDVTQPSPEDLAATKASQVKYLSKAMAADRQNALDLMSRTKAGGPLANAIMAKDYSPAEWDFQKVKDADGAESLIAVNKRDPSQMKKLFGNDPSGQPSLAQQKFAFEKDKDARDAAAQAKRDERDYGFKEKELGVRTGELATDNSRADDKMLLSISEKRAAAKTDYATSQSSVDLIDKGMGLIGKWGARGGPLSQARFASGLAVGENQAVELDRTLKAIAALSLKSVFGGSPSDGEREAFQKVIGDASAGKVAALSGLDNLRARAAATRDANKSSLAEYDAQAAKYTPKPAGTKPGGYGQSVGGPQDILNSRFQ